MASLRTQVLIDSHAHVQFPAYDDDRDVVVTRARDAGIGMVNVGTQRDTSEAAVRMAERYPEGAYATVGLHPIHTEASYHDVQEVGGSSESRGFTSRGEIFDSDFYRKLTEHPKVVAVGECGLDYYRLGEETKEKQKAAFIQQIGLAYEAKKPLMVHCRNAFADLTRILHSEFKVLNSPPGIIHFFSGTMDDARALLDLGFSFSFGGVITFAREYEEIVSKAPLDRILVETDAPYVAPAPYRGKRNEPAYIVETVRKIAEIKGIGYDEVARQTLANAKRLFGI